MKEARDLRGARPQMTDARVEGNLEKQNMEFFRPDKGTVTGMARIEHGARGQGISIASEL
ncbi:hypothetical protein N7462_004313 [Penicillium macrosclerotiorum]|uniref:uncharacterized protein n=1 Tax=Penicillium macrosclerotiorum TaxID=303699 RepID=UPI002548EDDA|nr:uncharacterized protein N7462_004313 [Penicillium macrosclerotiorum]KAJ5689921.1 hypothetical protein N7462_004313 [Penicillium macrosclerotiorum]